MTDTLYVHLKSTDSDSPVTARRVDADGTVHDVGAKAALRDLAASCTDAIVVAIIPGAEALTTTATLPKLRTSQIRSSVPFALEEFIAGDLDRQHFAIGGAQTRPADRAPSGGLDVPVAVIEKTRLAAYLSRLREAGIEAARLWLDESCIAAKPGDVVAWVHDEEVFLRAPTGEGLRCRLDDLPAAIGLLPADPPLSTLGLQLIGDDDTALIEAARRAEETRRFSRVHRATFGAALDTLIRQSELAHPIDLLQGEFAARRRATPLTPRWRLAAGLALALLALHAIDRAWVWQRAAAETRQIETELASAAGGSIDLRALTAHDAARGADTSSRVLRDALNALALARPAEGSVIDVLLEGGLVRLTFDTNTPIEPIVSALSAQGWRANPGTDSTSRPTITLQRTASEGAP